VGLKEYKKDGGGKSKTITRGIGDVGKGINNEKARVK